MAQDSVHIKYLVTNEQDKMWGLTINTVGTQTIGAGEDYPPRKHPTRYLFDTSNGRVLSEYQLLFLVQGSGRFYSKATSPDGVRINEGDMFLLFPGAWHNYHPDKDTGWKEMWIGFNGQIIDQWVKTGLISESRPIFHVGLKEEIISLYRQALRCADGQESAYQQMLCGIVCNLISSCIYYNRNIDYHKNNVQDIISGIRTYILNNPIEATPESAAAHMNVGYSKMRKLFKQYTGLTLGQYIAEVRTNNAKNLLSNTTLSIGEIAGRTGFINEEYFSTYFKRVTGITPTTYRNQVTGHAQY